MGDPTNVVTSGFVNESVYLAPMQLGYRTAFRKNCFDGVYDQPFTNNEAMLLNVGEDAVYTLFGMVDYYTVSGSSVVVGNGSWQFGANVSFTTPSTSGEVGVVIVQGTSLGLGDLGKVYGWASSRSSDTSATTTQSVTCSAFVPYAFGPTTVSCFIICSGFGPAYPLAEGNSPFGMIYWGTRITGPV